MFGTCGSGGLRRSPSSLSGTVQFLSAVSVPASFGWAARRTRLDRAGPLPGNIVRSVQSVCLVYFVCVVVVDVLSVVFVVCVRYVFTDTNVFVDNVTYVVYKHNVLSKA